MLRAVSRLIAETGTAPSLHEIGQAVGVNCVRARMHLIALEAEGFLRRSRSWRGIELLCEVTQ